MVDPELLTTVPLAAELPPGARRVLAARATVRRYAAGEPLWIEGAHLNSLHVVLEGHVRVVREARGRQHVLHSEGPGGTLGEVPLFTEHPAPATALAVTPTRCLLLTRDTIDAAIASEPTVAWALLRRLAERVRTLVERVDRLALQSTATRLGGLLLTEAERTGCDTVVLGMTQAALAAELGTVREVVVRALRTLREAGLIEVVGRGRLRIVSRTELRRFIVGTGD